MVIRKSNFEELIKGSEILENFSDKTVMAQVLDSNTGVFYKKEKGHHIHLGDICFEPGVYVKKARNIVKERLNKATNRSELILKYGYDSKFSMHLLRLLYEGIEILESGKLTFPLQQAVFLKDVRNGKLTLKEIIELSEDLENKMECLKGTTKLLAKPDFNKIEKYVVNTMETFLFSKYTNLFK